MTRFPGCAIVLASLILASSAFSQNIVTPAPGARPPGPGGPTGTQRPGMPPRDTARPAQTGTARLRGRVVSLETGAPLRRAQVSITGAETQLRRATTTDGEGRYEFVELPGGRFSLGANKAG